MSRKPTSLLAATALAAAAAACLAASPSGHPSPAPSGTAFPNAGLSGPQLQSAFKAAAAKGTAVHVKAAFKQSGQAEAIDMNLNKNGQAQGELTQKGANIPVKKVNGVTYIQLTPAFLKQEASAEPSITPQVIQSVQNKWVSSQSPFGQTLATSLAGLTDYTTFTNTLANGGAAASGTATPSMSAMPTPSASGTGSGTAMASPSPSGVNLSNLTAEGTTDLNGQTVAVYKNAEGTTAYFAAAGPAYLEKVVATGAEAGTATFTWNQPVTVTAPPASEIFNG